MTGTVLFGDDASASADLAWMWINAQRWADWDIDVLTAEPALEIGGDSSIQPWQPRRPRAFFNAAAAPPIRHLRSTADPRVAMLACRDRDLIVLGARGHGLLKAMHLGSTADWLMHNPPAPLVIARRGLPVRRAAVCTDGSADALAAAGTLARLPWVADVEVSVIAVQQPGLDAGQAVEQTAAPLAGTARRVRLVPLAGPDEAFSHVRDVILEHVAAEGSDLIVQGTTGQSRWSALRAGSIATSLATHAPCSVLMVHDHARSAATVVPAQEGRP